MPRVPVKLSSAILKRPAAAVPNRLTRSKGKQKHRCSCCGSDKHRLESCPLPGAKEILRLRSLVPKQVVRSGPLKHAPKTFPTKSTAYKDAARKSYSGGPPPRHLFRAQAKANSASVLDELEVPAEDAYKELINIRCLKKASRCLHCNAKVSKPRAYVYPGKLYVRCLSTKCKRRINVSDYSKFRGTRLTLSKLLKTVTFYCRTNRSKAPLVTDAVSQLQLKRWQVENIFRTIRSAEAKAGVAFCGKKKVAGNVEGDAHGLRKMYISPKNEHFQQEIEDALKRWKAKRQNRGKAQPKYWQGYLRVAGVKQRDGAGVIAVLPVKLTPPAAAPPPETTEEILDSGLLENINAKKPSVLHSDGAKSWPKANKKVHGKKVEHAAVSHKNFQFVKRLRTKKQPVGGARSAGTQCIDRWWESLDAYVPKQLTSKTAKGGDINTALFDYCFSFVWRSQLPTSTNMREAICKLL